MDKSCPEKNHHLAPPQNEPIAIIAMACRFPGADNITEFWQNLIEDREVMSEIPTNRWDWRTLNPSVNSKHNHTSVNRGGFINDIDAFDAAFFGISPREAKRMDPQQRLILELGWHCLENAGYAPDSLSGQDVGVFIGCGTHDYHLRQAQSGDEIERYDAAGTCSSAGISGRLSHFFNFHGPSQTIDAACASSMVALQQAIHALTVKECSAALVGGVHLMSSPHNLIALDRMHILSGTGRARAFDADADGYVRGEGAAVVMLKTLANALAEGDTPLAIIRGLAVNHNGRSRSVTSPNAFAQARVIRAAYEKCGLTPFDVNYIEANGTGSPLGDCIEIAGLMRAMRAFKKPPETTSDFQCALSSVKDQIGHLEAAAGLAGLIKTVLAMQHGRLPKTHNFKQLNPRINLQGAPFFVLQQEQEWHPLRDTDGSPLPRRAGISAFGLSGVNAHLVLEEAPALPLKKTTTLRGPLLLTLSAASVQSLKVLAQHYSTLLTNHPGEAGAICTHANRDRAQLTIRWACIAEHPDQLVTELRALTHSSDYTATLRQQLSSTKKLDVDTKDLLRRAQSFCQGEYVDWSSFYPDLPPLSFDLPLYPFEKTTYWVEVSETAKTNKTISQSNWMELNHDGCGLICQESILPQAGESYLLDHQLSGQSVLPAAGYVHLVLTVIARSEQLCGQTPFALEHLEFHRLLNINEPIQLKTLLRRQSGLDEEWAFEVLAQPNLLESAVCYASGKIRMKGLTTPTIPEFPASLTALSASDFYTMCSTAGWHYGQNFQAIRLLRYYQNTCWAEVSLPQGLSPGSAGTLHPVLLDAALQSLAPLITDLAVNQIPLPISLAGFQLVTADSQPTQLVSTLVSVGEESAEANVWLLDDDHKLVAVLTHLKVQFLPANRLDALLAQSTVQQAPGFYLPPACIPVDALVTLPQEKTHTQLAEGIGQILIGILGDAIKERLETTSDDRLNLTALGMDSLSSMEFKRQLKHWLQIDLSTDRLLGGSTLADLITVVQQKLLLNELTHPKTDLGSTTDMEVFEL